MHDPTFFCLNLHLMQQAKRKRVTYKNAFKAVLQTIKKADSYGLLLIRSSN